MPWDTLELAPAVPPLLLQQLYLAHATSHNSQQSSLFATLTVLTASGLTSAPTWVASPSVLIMLYKQSSEDATLLDNSFRKSLFTTKCIIALANNNLFVGFYIVTAPFTLSSSHNAIPSLPPTPSSTMNISSALQQ